ncbi:MAG: low molecular weight phosphatase family protein [Verrucomicrobiota bacterium]
MSEQTVLFLCTGNFYRSRYAEALFNHLVTTVGLSWKAGSKGFRPYLAGEDISFWVMEKLEQDSIPPALPQRMPEKVTKFDLAESSLVVALHEIEHAPMVKAQFPHWIDRVRYWHIPDIDVTPPAIALARIEHEVNALVEQLSAGHAFGLHTDCVAEF